MTKRDFEKLAAVFFSTRPAAEHFVGDDPRTAASDHGRTRALQWSHMVEATAQLCQAECPRFKFDCFVKACGHPAYFTAPLSREIKNKFAADRAEMRKA